MSVLNIMKKKKKQPKTPLTSSSNPLPNTDHHMTQTQRELLWHHLSGGEKYLRPGLLLAVFTLWSDKEKKHTH